MSKLNYLFTKDQLFERKNADQQKFEVEFKEEIPQFISSIDHSFKQMKDHRSNIPPSARDRNLNAVLMSGFLRGSLLEAFPDLINIDHTGRYFLTKNREWVVYFKKLNPKTLLPENIETKHVKSLHQQLTLSLNEISPIIYVGFTVTQKWDYITGYHAVYSLNNSIVWRSDLSEGISMETSNPNITIPDSTLVYPESEVVIRKKSV